MSTIQFMQYQSSKVAPQPFPGIINVGHKAEQPAPVNLIGRSQPAPAPAPVSQAPAEEVPEVMPKKSRAKKEPVEDREEPAAAAPAKRPLKGASKPRKLL